MPNVEAQKLDDMMRKVKGLLAKADHPNTPVDEADSARAMAERIMAKYRIEESTLIAEGKLNTDVFHPISRLFQVARADSEYSQYYAQMLAAIVQHVGAKSVWSTSRYDEQGTLWRTVDVIGYEADIRFAEVIFLAARIVFSDRMEPKRDPELSDQINVYRMRSAGMERIRIAGAMGFGVTTSATSKVTRLYKAECAVRGEDPTLTGRSFNVKVFRELYAEEFVTELYWRLHRARNAADSGEGGLVLADRSEKVQEAVYTKYPHLRPDPNRKAIGEGQASKAAREYKETAADRRRMERRYSAAGEAGARSGRRAASEVDVGGPKPTKRLTD